MNCSVLQAKNLTFAEVVQNVPSRETSKRQQTKTDFSLKVNFSVHVVSVVFQVKLVRGEDFPSL